MLKGFWALDDADGCERVMMKRLLTSNLNLTIDLGKALFYSSSQPRKI